MTKTATFALGVIAIVAAQAQTYTVLHRFAGTPDGAGPTAGLIADRAGNLFGATALGGAMQMGSVFKVDKAGESVLCSFPAGPSQGETGGGPAASLIRDAAGNFFGTTEFGGASNEGTVFKLDPSGNLTILYSFTGDSGGGNPLAGVIRDSAGNLYGTTYAGGNTCQFPNGCGVVFKLETEGTYTVLHAFTGGADGGLPVAGLIRDAEGTLYGTTQHGGASDRGTVFKLDQAGEKALYSFTGELDGSNPMASVIRDSEGNLYGTTFDGLAAGAVFKLDTAGRITVLHSFTGGADGGHPTAGLVMDSEGNLYGTTQNGGVAGGYSGYGVVFKVDTALTETVLHAFIGGADGDTPAAGLLLDSAGNLYGTTQSGGHYIGHDECPFGCGVVFKIAP